MPKFLRLNNLICCLNKSAVGNRDGHTVPTQHTVIGENSHPCNQLRLVERLHPGVPMKLALLTLVAAAALFGQPPDSANDTADETPAQSQTDLNVNSRYTIESIGFTDQRHYRLSTSAIQE